MPDKVDYNAIYDLLPPSLATSEVQELIGWIAGCYWQDRSPSEVAKLMLTITVALTSNLGAHHATH